MRRKAVLILMSVIVAVSTALSLWPWDTAMTVHGGGTLAVTGGSSSNISTAADGKYSNPKLATDYVQTSDNTKTRATGNYIVKSGKIYYEYDSIIDSAPSFANGLPIGCYWIDKGNGSYVTGNNLLSTTVNGTSITVAKNGETLSWNPILLIDDKEYPVSGPNPKLLDTDPINENYHNNTLEWDYGICIRRIRVIEGMISETWIFGKDPEGTIWIKENAVESKGFIWAKPPFAYDAEGNDIPISADKIVKAEDLKSAKYPVTIDPTTQDITTSAGDGFLEGINSNYNTAWTNTSANTVDNTSTISYTGQYKFITTYNVWRAFLYFNTSAIPDDASISSANVSLRGATDYSTTDFNITIQNGQPTYPHDPMVKADYDKSFYGTTDGGSYNTSGYSTNYMNIPMNSTGISWINTSGWTKLCLRSNRDISGTTPTGYEYVIFWSCECTFGASYRPYLRVVYTLPANISNTPASKDFGLMQESTSYWSNGSAPTFALNDSQCFFAVTNNGDIASITINATDFTGGVGWALNASVDVNKVVMKAGKSGDANEAAMVVLNSSPQAFISGLAASATKKWEIKLETGTFTDGIEKTSVITLVATLD